MRPTNDHHIANYQFTVHVLPGGKRVPPLYRQVERAWPSAPRVGDGVSLGGGDVMIGTVIAVEFTDSGKVTLKFLMQPEDVSNLIDLGFAPHPDNDDKQ